ncbi:hypothetical protein CY34DRAFT_93713, partial [Suillus luteus UH-Slu-Lm8-n1]
FNFFLMLVVDMLHKFELSVWKAIFTHLMCIVYSAGVLQCRRTREALHRHVPTFGRGTIRWFYKNTSAMKCLST